MTDTFCLRPAEGRLVRDPRTREPLPAEGATKPKDLYWLRRLRDGDVVEVPQAIPSASLQLDTVAVPERKPRKADR